MIEVPKTQFKLSDEIYNLMMEVSNIGVWEWPDLNNGDIRWSEGMYRFYDMDPCEEELSFEEILALIHPNDRERVQNVIQNHLHTGSELRADYRMITKKGNLKWLSASGKAQRTPEGVPVSMVGAIYEITDIKSSEEKMKSMAQFLSKVEDWSEMGSCKWFSKKDRFWLSEGAKKVLGIDNTEDILREEMLVNVHLDDRVRVFQDLNTHPPSDGNKIEFMLDRDGLRHVEMAAFSYVDPMSGEEIVTGIIKDITEYKKQVNEIAELNQELNRSNEELEQFAYIASHDLQEPLRKIRTFGERLRDRATDLDERSLDYLGRMDNAAERMQGLIKDLLEFSQVSRNEGEPELIKISEVVASVVEDLGARVDDKQASVEISGNLPMILGHESQLYRLFLNFLSNALKFHEEGSKPKVKVYSNVAGLEELRNAGFRNVVADEYARIAVEDNGIGFDEKYLEKIFAIFQRLHGRAEYEGTGIGLAMCQRIAANHEGYVTAKSAPGQGATFYAYFPLAENL